jgi:uncharacterized protein (DUF305 family)
MHRIMLSISAAILLSAANAAFAQEAMPEACSGGHMGQMMGQMMGQQMPGMMDMSGMNDMQKAYMEGMNKMNTMMMPGMMAEDPDVAFICGMIAHHRGAIDMAKVELQYGKDAWTKELAQKIIDAQTQEIADMTKWLGEHAK